MQFRIILSLALKEKCYLRQGDVKNAFCNGTLPNDEVVVVRPPTGCPNTLPNTLWKLKKTLYGLVHSPQHWYQNISTFFQSIGLCNSPNSPCLFIGQILPNHPPLIVGLYVDNFCNFSTSNAVELHFKQHLDNKYTVSYNDKID